MTTRKSKAAAKPRTKTRTATKTKTKTAGRPASRVVTRTPSRVRRYAPRASAFGATAVIAFAGGRASAPDHPDTGAIKAFVSEKLEAKATTDNEAAIQRETDKRVSRYIREQAEANKPVFDILPDGRVLLNDYPIAPKGTFEIPPPHGPCKMHDGASVWKVTGGVDDPAGKTWFVCETMRHLVPDHP